MCNTTMIEDLTIEIENLSGLYDSTDDLVLRMYLLSIIAHIKKIIKRLEER